MSGIDFRIARLFRGKKSLVISALDHVMEYGDQPGIEDAAVAIRNCMGTDALLMSRFMLRRNPGLMAEEHAPLPVVRMTEAELRERATRGEVKITPRVKMSALDVTTRKRSFDEVRRGYSDQEAQAEAARCLACGVCSECLSCYYKCGVHAIDHDMLERTEQIKTGAVILAPGQRRMVADQAAGEWWGGERGQGPARSVCPAPDVARACLWRRYPLAA